MIRFATDLVHVRAHQRCASRVKVGTQCTAMTNYLCALCKRGVCGRHVDSHNCATTAVTE